MYCQHCGAETPPDLKYCKRCGGNLNPSGATELAARPGVSPASVWGVGATTFLLVVGGLVVLFGFLYGMAQRGLHPPAIMTLALFGALTILGSVALLVRLWRILLTGGHMQASAPRAAAIPRPAASYELPPQRVSAITEGFGHVPSVTEHTTRTFEPAYKEKG